MKALVENPHKRFGVDEYVEAQVTGRRAKSASQTLLEVQLKGECPQWMSEHDVYFVLEDKE